jgi:shikimate kinase
MKLDQTVFLIGFMGCGKTYWGEKVADHLSLPFYDLDALIEGSQTNSIPGIFEKSGEDSFRILEQETLQECLLLGPAIVATGGGTPCFFDNMDWMNTFGRTIYLKTPASILADRLQHQQHFRPLLAHVPPNDLEAHIEKMLHHREPFYNKATFILEQTGEDEVFFEKLSAFLRDMGT